jgi:hypothetical protein
MPSSLICSFFWTEVHAIRPTNSSTGSPPTRLTAIPDKWVRPTRRPADLLVGPTDLVGGPHNLLKTFQKIPQTT